VTAPSGRIQYLNAAGRRLLGVAGGPDAVRAAGLDVRAVQPQFAPGGASAGAVAAATARGAWRGETTLTKCDGREIPVEQVILAHRGADGEIEYLSSILRDVTERKQAEATLRAFALVDELTGLYNRRGFLALAEREWEAARAGGQGAVLVYLDLDGFKAINDTYGHAEGDRALAAVAGVLRRTFRDADVVGRLGGDEFVAFARTGAAGPRALEHARETAARVQHRLQALLAEATLATGRPYTLAGSAGVALFDPAAPATLSALMVEADAALYDRKRARKRAAAAA
jgi:diguanylate cyclase (GGDEF)-like protein